jgi:hypothetical protein
MNYETEFEISDLFGNEPEEHTQLEVPATDIRSVPNGEYHGVHQQHNVLFEYNDVTYSFTSKTAPRTLAAIPCIVTIKDGVYKSSEDNS